MLAGYPYLAGMELQLRSEDLAEGLFATNADGAEVRFDAGSGAGGTDAAFRPMQMVLASCAACSAIDVLQILDKQRQEYTELRVVATARRREEPPKIFTAIHLHFEAAGQVEEAKLKRAVELSVTKYCSVAEMLRHTAEITFEAAVV